MWSVFSFLVSKNYLFSCCAVTFVFSADTDDNVQCRKVILFLLIFRLKITRMCYWILHPQSQLIRSINDTADHRSADRWSTNLADILWCRHFKEACLVKKFIAQIFLILGPINWNGKPIEIVYIEKRYTAADIQGMGHFSTILAPRPTVCNKLESYCL
jgi:hypothetical protein